MFNFSLCHIDSITPRDFYYNEKVQAYTIDLKDYDLVDISESELKYNDMYPLDDSTEARLVDFDDNVACALYDWELGNQKDAITALRGVVALEATRENTTSQKVMLELMHQCNDEDLIKLLLAAA